MKEPESLDIETCLSRIDGFSQILDVRSESEFALDHLPGAINTPVLNDQQRVYVGTIYKQIGAFEAKRIGAALVARNIAEHLEERFNGENRDWRPLVYCWRGGNRSAALATIMARIGWQVSLLAGGYRAFRQMVNLQMAVLPDQLSLRVIAGRTGSGKTALLGELERRGAQVLDLESLANHRGSVLGAVPNVPQPPQKWFETQIWQRLRQFDTTRLVYVESESKKVGQNHVPEALIKAMRAAPCIAINADMPTRVRHLAAEYPFFIEDSDLLKSKLASIRDLHGAARLAHWQELIDQRKTDELVEDLLRNHYDPSYDRSIARNFKRIDQSTAIELSSADLCGLQQAASQILALE